MAKKSVAETYRVLDEVQHVLQRPGMYLGQIGARASTEWVPRDGGFAREEVTYSPALLKIFDEIVTNSVDESVRNPRLDEIRVTVAASGEVCVWDSGGIPVVPHPEHGKLVPELVFSNMRAGSNFDDAEDRRVAGTHGLGSTLTNIFSRRFSVETADGKKRFEQTFEDNLSKRGKPRTAASKKRYTSVDFLPDYQRFGLSGMDEAHLLLIKKRVMDLAACNPRVRFSFNGERLRFASFRAYADMYCRGAAHERSEGWEVAVGHSPDGPQQVSFVNSAETKDGGTHLQHVVGQVVDGLREMILKKHKVEVRPADIRQHLFVLVSANVRNPSFATQTKEKLITPPGDMAGKHEVSQKLLKAVFASEAVASVLDWVRRKEEAAEAAELRRTNRGLDKAKVKRLIDATGSNRARCSLGIFEGLSASTAVRKFRDPAVFGAFPLKGKFVNVSELRPSEVAENAEALGLMGALGLRIGEPVGDSVRYGRVLIYTDADTDGSSIFCLLLNFFARHWPELFDRGMVYRVLTPLAVAERGKEKRYIYTMAELSEWSAKPPKGWDLEYKKGLGSLSDEDFSAIIRDPILMRVDRDAAAKRSLEDWFGPDAAPRKVKLMQ